MSNKFDFRKLSMRQLIYLTDVWAIDDWASHYFKQAVVDFHGKVPHSLEDEELADLKLKLEPLNESQVYDFQMALGTLFNL